MVTYCSSQISLKRMLRKSATPGLTDLQWKERNIKDPINFFETTAFQLLSH